MSRRRLLALALLAGALGCGSETPASGPPSQPVALGPSVRADSLLGDLRQRPFSGNLEHTLTPLTLSLDTPAFTAPNRRQIVIKFREGSSVRLRGEALAIDSAETLELAGRLTRQGLGFNVVNQDLAAVDEIVARSEGELITAGGEASEADLTALRREAEAFTRREHPDLNLYYYLLLNDGQNAERILADIQRLRTVETAYFQPVPINAADAPPRTTLSLASEQGYLRSAPRGIDVDHARDQPGGRGEGVRVIDIEYGWHPQHEDFPAASSLLIDDAPCDDEYKSHGTAVIGALWAEENGFGITGIVPNAEIGRVSPWRRSQQGKCYYSIVAALKAALGQARRGDIILIEQQINVDGGLAPVELDQQNFDMIVTLTSVGMVVIEAAGNGSKELVRDPDRDSGAIMVGAGHPDTHAALPFSNYGTRLDVQGWGERIATLGLGERPIGQADPRLRINGGDELQWYTTEFNGTSGASPIVAGAAAIIQANRVAAGLAPLNSCEMRLLLRRTGTQQGQPSNQIGPLPNLQAALRASANVSGQRARC